MPVAARAHDVDSEQLLVEEVAKLERPVRQRDVARLLAPADGLDELHRRAAPEPDRRGGELAFPGAAEDRLAPALDELGVGELLVERHQFRREGGHDVHDWR